jgi:hypothetical protein
MHPKPIALLAVFVSLVLPAAVAAKPTHYATLTISRAKREIIRWGGPGTTTPRCWRLSHRSVECRYETPAENAGLGFEAENATLGPWQSWAIAEGARVRPAI